MEQDDGVGVAHERRRALMDLPSIGWRPRFSDERVASTRLRYSRPFRVLRSRGWATEIFEPHRAASYDIVVYGKRYDIAATREAERLKRSGVRIVFDLCDNHFYNPFALPSLADAPRWIGQMTEIADQVVVSTAALAEVMAEQLEVPRPKWIIGDAIELEHDPSFATFGRRHWESARGSRVLGWIKRRRREGRIPLIWFGIHGGPNADYGMRDLSKIRSVIESADRVCPVSLTVVSNSRREYRRRVQPWKIPTRYLEWSPLHFVDVLRAHDVAVIPININPFTWCKSNNRLAQSLSCEVAVAADAIPSYEEFRDVALLDDWSGFEAYLRDADRRKADIVVGGRRCRERYSVEVIADRWEALFRELAGV